ncbi:MAG: hypothetical protein HYV16_06095 [Gammaproteobacteria bacterium]|nr:hypothetical protein [Gammaproteobacteria bacterium]
MKFVLILISLLFGQLAQAACSAYMGQAVINEVYKGTGAPGNGRFYEVRLLASISSAVTSGWSLRICTAGGSCTTTGLSNADGDLFLLNSSTPSTTYFALGNIDIVLRDADGNAIDYLSTGTTSGQYAGLGCTSFPYDIVANPLASNTFAVRRVPDGTGNWTSSSGNSGGSTPDTSNDGSTPSTLAAFRIFHAGQAINCQGAQITIRAVDSGGNTLSSFTGTINLSTSTGHGTWSNVDGLGTLSAVGNDTGTASYAFVAADNGEVVLKLDNRHTESLNIDLSFGGITESASYDPDLVFMPQGFQFIANGSTTLPHQIAGRTFTGGPFILRAVSTDESNNQCTALLDVAGAVGMAAECEDPTTCTANPVYGGSTSLPVNPDNNVTSYTGIAVNFVNGETTLASLRHDDAGQLRLHARATLSIAGVSQLLTGVSNAFVVRPFAFALAVPGNPAAADATGAPFQRAGAVFSGTARAVMWQGADDANGDGLPDVGANLADNATTPGFGRHVSAPTVTLSHSLVSPAGGDAGTLGGGGSLGAFTTPANGEKALSLSWNEVGVIGLSADTADYLGSGLAITGSLSPIGRFYPASMSALILAYAPVCAAGNPPFTYAGLTGTKAGQPFAVTAKVCACRPGAACQDAVTGDCLAPALNFDTTNLPSTNYASRVTGATASLLSGAAPWAAGSLSLVNALNFENGTATLNDPAARLDFTAAQAPQSLNLQLAVCDHNGTAPTDSSCTGTDDNAASTVSAAAVSFRLGRLRLVSASAPVDQALDLPAQAEVWTGTQWLGHGADQCTNPDGALASLSAYTDNLAAGETTASDGAAGLTAGQSASLIRLSAPGAGNDGSLQVLLDLTNAGNFLPWLREDWNGDGALDPGPTATASFGQYRGSDRIIEWREVN